MVIEPEPRRWRLTGDVDCPTATQFAGEPLLASLRAVEVIEAAPVEAELERLRDENAALRSLAGRRELLGAELERLRLIEAAARAIMLTLDRSGSVRLCDVDALREALER